MDAYLTIASKREVRDYADRPIPDDVVEDILNAGRIAGSAKNRQPWRFLVLEDRGLVESVAEKVYAPGNIMGAKLVVAIVTPGAKSAFDVGRAAQNMMLAAWSLGVGSSPNGVTDAEAVAELLGLDDERPVIILSFGYPARPRDPNSRPPEEWIRRAKRKPFDQVVERR